MSSLDESVTLDDVVAIVSQKRVPLAPELGGYLALEIAEQCTQDDSDVELRQVYVSEEGSVAVVRTRKGSSGGAEASVRAVLAKLLEAAGSQTPALAASAKKKPGGGIPALIEELEAALIPVNRSAGRRALARLAREVKRVVLGVGRNASSPPSERRASSPVVKAEVQEPPPAQAAPMPSKRPPSAASEFESEESPTTARREVPAEVMESAIASSRESESELPTVGISRAQLDDAQKGSRRDSVDSLLDKFEVTGGSEDKALSRDLKAIAGLDPTPPPPTVASQEEDDGVDALLSEDPSESLQPKRRDESARKRREDSKPRLPSFADERQLPTSPTKIRRRKAGEKGPSNLVFGVLILLFLMAGAAALWMLKPGFFTGRTPEKVQQEKDDFEKEKRRQEVQAATPQCRTSLVLSDAPDGAELLVRAGQAPADIDKMPVGVRLEFVATADGYAPKRAVLPAGTPWDNGADGKPRFELAVQLDKSKLKPGQVDPWPAAELNTEVGGKGNGPPGVVHVISSPKGAEVWLLAGLGPSATIDDLSPCDADLDLLVAGPKALRKRMKVPAAQFVPDAARAGWRTARVTVGSKP